MCWGTMMSRRVERVGGNEGVRTGCFGIYFSLRFRLWSLQTDGFSDGNWLWFLEGSSKGLFYSRIAW